MKTFTGQLRCFKPVLVCRCWRQTGTQELSTSTGCHQTSTPSTMGEGVHCARLTTLPATSPGNNPPLPGLPQSLPHPTGVRPSSSFFLQSYKILSHGKLNQGVVFWYLISHQTHGSVPGNHDCCHLDCKCAVDLQTDISQAPAINCCFFLLCTF